MREKGKPSRVEVVKKKPVIVNFRCTDGSIAKFNATKAIKKKMEEVFKFDDEFEKKNRGEFYVPRAWRHRLANVPVWIREYYKQKTIEEICKKLKEEIYDLYLQFDKVKVWSWGNDEVCDRCEEKFRGIIEEIKGDKE